MFVVCSHIVSLFQPNYTGWTHPASILFAAIPMLPLMEDLTQLHKETYVPDLIKIEKLFENLVELSGSSCPIAFS